MLHFAAMDDSKREIITNLLHSKGFRAEPPESPAILGFHRRTDGTSDKVYILDLPLSFPVRISVNGVIEVRNLIYFSELLNHLENLLS